MSTNRCCKQMLGRSSHTYRIILGAENSSVRNAGVPPLLQADAFIAGVSRQRPCRASPPLLGERRGEGGEPYLRRPRGRCRCGEGVRKIRGEAVPGARSARTALPPARGPFLRAAMARLIRPRRTRPPRGSSQSQRGAGLGGRGLAAGRAAGPGAAGTERSGDVSRDAPGTERGHSRALLGAAVPAAKKALGPPVPAAEAPRVPGTEDPGIKHRLPASPGPWEKAPAPGIPGRRQQVPGFPGPRCGGSLDPRCKGCQEKALGPCLNPGIPVRRVPGRRHRVPAESIRSPSPRCRGSPGARCGGCQEKAPGPRCGESPDLRGLGAEGPGRRCRVPGPPVRCKGSREKAARSPLQRGQEKAPAPRVPGEAALQNGHGRAAGRQRRCGFVPPLRDAPVALPSTRHLPPAWSHPPPAEIKAFEGLHREFGMVPLGAGCPLPPVPGWWPRPRAVRKNSEDRKVSFLLSLSLF
ncbi:collagen alpha-1(I) chain-like [Zonotrichia leucophrys gambelii]|uniref:collagen alpha-1(I) chain-like n=1 Tax=Zonotrichia leucophrys gambelii TaxID=257770 RepID=UPI0031401216